MYLQIDILDNLESEAEKFIMDNDRMMYLPFFEAAEKFCAENSVLIGGRIGIDLLVGREVSQRSFYWELYCDDTFNAARAFAVALSKVSSPHIPADTVALQTNIRHKEFTISIYARSLFKIYSMDKYRNIKLVDLMGPAVRTSYFTKIPIKCISEEMQLIAIYRTLYSPAKLSLWREELVNENKIYNLIKDSLGEKATKEISGGSPNVKAAARDMQCLLMDKLIRKTNNVLIGDHAMFRMKLIKDPTRIQFISSDNIEQIEASCEKILNQSRSGRAGYKITHVRYPLNIPDDFQILKYTIYVTDGKEQTPIADIFNSSQYEMIPFAEKDNIKIGNPWVLLRFLFIDIWILKLILNIGSDNTEFIKGKIRTNLTRCDLIRENITDVLEVFQSSNYVGSFVDDYIAKKKLIKEKGERFPNFYPAKANPNAASQSVQSVQSIRGSDESNTQETLQKRLTSGPIDINIDTDIKKQIMMKIVGKVVNDDIMTTLREYAKSSHEYSKWGVNKSIKAYFRKNYSFLPFIPPQIDTCVDIGCGSGMDFVVLKSRYRIRTGICIDIEDTRDSKYKNASKFVKVELDKPYDIPDEVADLVIVFHSIHHMQEDISKRLKDIARITKPGGTLFLKDHNVTTPDHASNVDFEHLVYMAPEWKGELTDLINNFNKYEPMNYYSSAEINKIMIDIGFERLWYSEFNKRTNVYGAVYRKK